MCECVCLCARVQGCMGCMRMCVGERVCWWVNVCVGACVHEDVSEWVRGREKVVTEDNFTQSFSLPSRFFLLLLSF